MAPDPTPDPLVTVHRGPGDWEIAKFRLSDITRLHWDTITGGARIPTPYPHVFGYVICTDAVTGSVAHRGDHGPCPHEIKVCILKKYNKRVWPLILAQAGPKPWHPRRKR